MTECHPPVLSVPIRPSAAADRARLLNAVSQLESADAALTVDSDEAAGDIILGGMSEHQLDRCIGRLKTEYGLRLDVGAPQIAYRETITEPAEVDHTHKKTVGGAIQFARVKVRFEPIDPEREARFENGIAARTTLAAEFLRGAEAGVAGVFRSGILAAFPVFGVTATLVDGAWHDRDSTEVAFEIAAQSAAREAMAKGKAVLLEPIMRVEVTTPGDSANGIAANLRLRRGEIWKQRALDGNIVIGATVPLSNMLGYQAALLGLSNGCAAFEMQFSHYAPVPKSDCDGDPPFRLAAAMRA